MIKMFPEFKARIEQLVANGNLEEATISLMDCAKECSSSDGTRKEALLLRADFSELRSEVTRFDETDATRRIRKMLYHRVLELLNSIEREINAREPLSSAPDARQAPAPGSGHQAPNPTAGKTGALYLSAANVTKKFRDFRLNNVSIDLKAGEITALVGENGSGKTTLLKILAGVLKPDDGELLYPLATSDNWHLKKQEIGYLSQESYRRDWRWGDIRETLRFVAAIHGYRGAKNREAIDHIIYRLRLEDHIDKKWPELSGGYQTRFNLAAILIRQPKILLLDEPLAHPDILVQQLFLKDLKAFVESQKEPMAICVSSQHINEIESLANNILFLEKGSVRFYGPKTEINRAGNNNYFELECALAIPELCEVFQSLHPDIGISEWGTYVVVSTPRHFRESDILGHLLTHRVSIHYFRNVSASTKSYFYKL